MPSHPADCQRCMALLPTRQVSLRRPTTKKKQVLIQLSIAPPPFQSSFVSFRSRHQFHRGDRCENFLETGTQQRRFARHLEGTNGSSLVLSDRRDSFENERQAETAQQPSGVLDPFNTDAARVAQRSYPNLKWIHRICPCTIVVYDPFDFGDGNSISLQRSRAERNGIPSLRS